MVRDLRHYRTSLQPYPTEAERLCFPKQWVEQNEQYPLVRIILFEVKKSL